jgi:hypothetical protein
MLGLERGDRLELFGLEVDRKGAVLGVDVDVHSSDATTEVARRAAATGP